VPLHIGWSAGGALVQTDVIHDGSQLSAISSAIALYNGMTVQVDPS
jgi:hypothetical protein